MEKGALDAQDDLRKTQTISVTLKTEGNAYNDVPDDYKKLIF